MTTTDTRQDAPMCECGHDAWAHLSIGYVTEDCRKCDCPNFRIRATPTPKDTP